MMNEIIGIAYAVLASIVAATATVFNKKSSNNLHESVLGLYFCLGSAILSPIWSFACHRSQNPLYSWNLVAFIIVLSLFFYLTLYLMAYSVKFLTPWLSGILIYVTIPAGYLLDHQFFGRQFNMLEILGASIIVVISMTSGILKSIGII